MCVIPVLTAGSALLISCRDLQDNAVYADWLAARNIDLC